MKSDQAVEGVAETLQQLIGLGVVLFKRSQHLLRRLRRIDQCRHPLQLRLVLVQVVVADLQQALERDVDHFVVVQFLAIQIRAETIVALRNW